MFGKIKVVLLHNIFTPHIVPLFRRLHQTPEIDLKVFFTSFSSPERNWVSPRELGFNCEILPKIRLSYQGKDYFSYVINPTFPYRLWKEKMDVLIAGGYDSFSSQIGYFMCKALRRPYILWSGSTHYEESWRRRMAQPLIKFLVRNGDALLAYGSRSRDLLIDLGAMRERVIIAPNTVDIEYFSKESQIPQLEKEALKKRTGIRTPQVILYVGQLIERKGLQYLIPAFGRLKREVPDISLLLIGSGNQEKRYKALCEEEQILDIHFLGHKDIDEIPKYYGIANVLVLPSLEEVWGLVINEAMACSLPVISTRKVGAAADLIQEGINGFIVKEGVVEVLYDALRRLILDPSLQRKMGEASFQLIQNFSIEQCAEKFLYAIKTVHAQNPVAS